LKTDPTIFDQVFGHRANKSRAAARMVAGNILIETSIDID
jgi:hypothetical protein